MTGAVSVFSCHGGIENEASSRHADAGRSHRSLTRPPQHNEAQEATVSHELPRHEASSALHRPGPSAALPEAGRSLLLSL